MKRGYTKASVPGVLASEEERRENRLLSSEKRIEDSLKSLTDAVARLDTKVTEIAIKLTEKLPGLIKIGTEANNKAMMWKDVYGSGAFLTGLAAKLEFAQEPVTPRQLFEDSPV